MGKGSRFKNVNGSKQTQELQRRLAQRICGSCRQCTSYLREEHEDEGALVAHVVKVREQTGNPSFAVDTPCGWRQGLLADEHRPDHWPMLLRGVKIAGLELFVFTEALPRARFLPQVQEVISVMAEHMVLLIADVHSEVTNIVGPLADLDATVLRLSTEKGIEIPGRGMPQVEIKDGEPDAKVFEFPTKTKH